MKVAIAFIFTLIAFTNAHKINLQQTGMCNEDCNWSQVDNGNCDPECFYAECNWDGNDCPSWWPRDEETTEEEEQTTDDSTNDQTTDDSTDETTNEEECNMEEVYYREPVSAILGTTFNKKGYSSWTYEDFARVQAITVYFTASWCGPCQTFTPQLESFYIEVNSGNCFKYENVASLYENTQSDYDTYSEKMSWAIQPFQTYNVYGTYSVSSIPTLILIHKDGSEANRNAKSDVSTGVSTFDGWVSTVASYSNSQYETEEEQNDETDNNDQTNDDTSDDQTNDDTTDDSTNDQTEDDSSNDQESNGDTDNNTGYNCKNAWVGDGVCDPPCAVKNGDGGDCNNLPSGCTVSMIGDGNCDSECYSIQTMYDFGDCPDGV